MAYETLYRRFRPQDFDFLVGQGPVKTALKNAIASGRISHAYLFSGPRGTGKTSTARILAKALCCDEGPTPHPCGKCGNCEKITLGTSMDVFEIDAASNRGIEEIKALREQLAFAPVEARYKVYIIDEVHMMTPEAFNALLKTLEEPPAHVIFILATTDAHKIPATIHSRCQRFDFRRMTVGEITGHLKKVAEESGIDAEDEALRLMAIQAEGGLRDALSLLEQCSVVDKNVTAESVRATLGIVGCEVTRAIAENIGKNNLPAVLMDLNRLFEDGKEAGQILAELAGYMRAVLLYKTTPEFDEIYLTDTAENFAEVAGLFSNARIIEAQEKIHSALKELKDAMRTRITTELCFFDLCRDEGTLADFAARVERLEEQLAVGLPVKPAGRESAETPPKEAPIKKAALKKAPAAEALADVKPEIKSKESKESKEFKEEAAKARPERKKKENASLPAPENSENEEEADGKEYWQAALAILKEEKKNSMVSCAKNGRPVSLKNGVLTVEFGVKFQCDRMNKEDYNKAFEDALLRTCRKKIHLYCVTGEIVNKVPDDVHERVRSVMDAFGESLEIIREE